MSISLRKHKYRAYVGMTVRLNANRGRDWHRDWFWYPRLCWILQPRGAYGGGAQQWICADSASPHARTICTDSQEAK